jgi:hypothetical protein
MSERRADVFVDLESDPRSKPPTFVHLVPESGESRAASSMGAVAKRGQKPADVHVLHLL